MVFLPLTRYQQGITVLLLVVIGILTYANVCTEPLFWDDEETVLTNGFIRDIRYIPHIFTSSYHGGGGGESNIYRPLATLSFLVEYHLWRLAPAGYHVTNMVLHCLNGVLLYGLLMLIMGNTFVALTSALLFLVHPLQTEVVNYVSHRTELLMLCFFLQSFMGYLLWMRRRQWWYLVWSLGAFILSLLSKEMGMSLPLFIMLYLTLMRSWSRRAATALLLYGAIFAVYVALRLTVLKFTQGADIAHMAAGTDLGIAVMSIARITATYMRLFIAPYDLHMERDIPIVTSWADGGAWIAVILIMLVSAGIVMLRRVPGVVFGAVWFIIAYIPVANIIPLQIAIAEHYMYLPSCGVMIMAAGTTKALLDRLPGVIKLLVVWCGLAGLVVCMVITIQRNSEWGEPLRLYFSTVRHARHSYRVHNNIGVEYFRRGNIREGQDYFDKALAINPDYVPAINNRGVCYERAGDLERAYACYAHAAQRDPRYFLAYKNYGFLMMRCGRRAEAQALFEHARDIYPFDESVTNALAQIQHARATPVTQ